MDRIITGYHQDDDGDWIAELACGHNQHVRHRPPFHERPWVLSEQDRASRVGTPLSCPLCDRAELPAGLRLVRSSPEWNEHTLPDALRRIHRLAPGTWGRIVLRHGHLRLALATTPSLEVELTGNGATHAIPPEVDHDVQPAEQSGSRSNSSLPTDRQPWRPGSHERSPIAAGTRRAGPDLSVSNAGSSLTAPPIARVAPRTLEFSRLVDPKGSPRRD